MERESLRVSGYGLLSRYRGELMGLAMLWVMLFHAYKLRFGVLLLDGFKALGFAGVDIFLLLSGMGLYVSLSQTIIVSFVLLLRTTNVPHPSGLLAGGGCLQPVAAGPRAHFPRHGGLEPVRAVLLVSHPRRV